MYDSFDMACHDDDPDLRLNIKVNSENLLPIPQKYNLGSLRLPADPSWPKIPQRKLTDDVGDSIHPSCVVTSTGTPRKNRTIVRTPQSQSHDSNASKLPSHNHCNNSYLNKAQTQQSQQLRSRRSGCADPRFKKVTTAVRNQMTSTDPGDDDKIDEKSGSNCCKMITSTESRKPIEEEKTAVNTWKESNRAQVVLQQEAERPDETKGNKESIGVQTVQIDSFEFNTDTKEPETNTSIINSNEPDNALKNTEANITLKNEHFVFETNYNSKQDPSGVDKTPQSIPQCSQGKQEQLFSMVEKKVQANHTLMASNTLGPDVSPGQEKQSFTQSYGVQVPLLSYQNVPVQISSEAKSKVDDTAPRFFINSLNSNDKSGILFDNIVDIPKLELPDDVDPQFLNFIDRSNTPRDNEPFSCQMIKQEKSVDQSAVTGSQKKIDDSKLQRDTQFQNGKHQFDHRNSAAMNKNHHKINENHRLQFKSGRKNLVKLGHNKEEKYCQHKNIFNISGDTFIPNHDFHIHYNEEKKFDSQAKAGFNNVSRKLCDIIQSPRYRTVTTDSEGEKRGYSIDESQDKLIQNKTNSRFNNHHQQTTDSESQTSDIGNEESAQPQLNVMPKTKREKNHSQNFFADDNRNKKFQSPDQKTVYFEEHNKTKISTQNSKYKTEPNYEQCRASFSRQKRKHLMLNKKRVQSSEPQISSVNRKQSRTPCLKKANSYLSRYTQQQQQQKQQQQQQQITPDSEHSYVAQNQNCRPSSACGANVSSMKSQDNSSKNTVQGNKIWFSGCKEMSGNRIRDESVLHPTDLNEIKREHCIKPYERPSTKNAKITSSLELKKQKNIPYSVKSPRVETDEPTIEKPTAIPIKTQQLLNKSYWEYYNKLKLDKMDDGVESPQQQYFCQVAMGAPRLKKRKTPEEIVEESINCDTSSQAGEQMKLSLPEIRTLEQCSVLSTMINKTLDSTLQPSSETIQTKQIYLNGNMRSSSDPTAGTQSAILKKLFSRENENSITSSTLVHNQNKDHKRHKKIDNNTLFKLKSIGEHPVVFFGCMAYALVVFLPMIYDYLFYEEHDEYEDLSYVEIFFDYAIASFTEVLGEFFDMMNKIFFKPVR